MARTAKKREPVKKRGPVQERKAAQKRGPLQKRVVAQKRETVKMRETAEMNKRAKEYEDSFIYREATGQLTMPWDPQHYVIPREIGGSPTDVTSFMPGQQWSEEDLPNMLYVLKPPPGWIQYRKKSRSVGIKRDEAGNPIMERWPLPGEPRRPLRNFPALPDQIGTMDHPLFFLAWRKLEPAATWRDFLVRMEDVKGKPGDGNPLSMRINRLLELFVLPYTWHGTKDFVRPTADQLRREASLSAQARANNTTRGKTPGLIDPSKGEEGGRIPYPEIPGNCEGRGAEWPNRWTLKLREMAASAKNDSSTEPSISEVDESGDEPCPELEVDYIAKFQEQYPNGRDFDNESTISDPPYPGAEPDVAFPDHEESFGLEGFVNPSKLSDHTSYAYPRYCATQKYGETNNSESFGGHSYVYDQPHPTTQTDHLHQETNQFEGSDGQSHASSDRMFPDQDFQSFGSQSTAPIAGFETQPFGPNTSLHQFGDQVASPVIGYGAQPLDPSTSFRSFEDYSTAPVVGLEAQPFPSNASFKPVDNHPEVVFHEFVNSHVYEAQSGLQHFQSTGSFQTFENQPATIFDEFVHADSYETESDLESSDSQSTSSLEGDNHPQDNESQSGSNTSDNQGFPTPDTAVAETPMDLDFIDDRDSEDDESDLEEPVYQQESSRYSPDVSMYDHHNGPYY